MDECLTYAIDSQERFGIWGGLSERQRRVVLRLQTSGAQKAELDAFITSSRFSHQRNNSVKLSSSLRALIKQALMAEDETADDTEEATAELAM